MQRFGTGLLPSPVLPTDYWAQDFLPQSIPAIPDALDLRPFCQPIQNQGSTPTCTAFATASTMMGVQQMTFVPPGQSAPDKEVLSAYWLYAALRERFGYSDLQPGAKLVDALYVARRGIPEAKHERFDDQGKYIHENLLAKLGEAELQRNRIKTWSRVKDDPLAICTALAMFGSPILMAIGVGDEYMQASGDQVLQGKGDFRKFGSHANGIVGYNLKDEYFIIRNQYGEAWGNKGYSKISFDYKIDERYASTPAVGDTPPPDNLLTMFWDFIQGRM